MYAHKAHVCMPAQYASAILASMYVRAAPIYPCICLANLSMYPHSHARARSLSFSLTRCLSAYSGLRQLK